MADAKYENSLMGILMLESDGQTVTMTMLRAGKNPSQYSDRYNPIGTKVQGQIA